VIWHPQTDEPEHTIYVDRWRAALARLRALDGEQKRLFTDLLAHVDAGWEQVRQLQLALERHTPSSAENATMREILAFIDGDIVDTFREMAFDAAALVPGWKGWADAADLGDMDGDASLFMRYLNVLRLAATSVEFPARMTEVITRVWTGLEGWDTEFARLLRAIDKTIILPSLAGQDG
jgi:hypothetical protein